MNKSAKQLSTKETTMGNEKGRDGRIVETLAIHLDTEIEELESRAIPGLFVSSPIVPALIVVSVAAIGG
jgi:hypothetical protein